MPLRVVTKLCFRKPFHRLNISMRINSAAPSGNALPSLRHSLPCRCESFQRLAHAHQCITDASLINIFAVRSFATTVRCGASTDHYSSTPEPCYARAMLRFALPPPRSPLQCRCGSFRPRSSPSQICPRLCPFCTTHCFSPARLRFTRLRFTMPPQC